MDSKSDKPKLSIRWQAPEFHFYEKNSKWYLLITIASIFIISFFVYLGIAYHQFSYYLAAAVVFAAASALFSQSRIQPKATEFHLDNDGVIMMNQKYTWDKLKTFWIADRTLNIEQKKFFALFLSAPLGDLNAEEVRQFLLQYLPEKSNGGQFIFEKINRLIKF